MEPERVRKVALLLAVAAVMSPLADPASVAPVGRT